MAIVSPIVVLTIGTFITIIVSLMTDAVADRQSNLLSYNLQDALSRIETDIKYSNQFLEQNDISLTLPQGANNDTTVFKNVTSSSTSLILSTNATTENPSSATGSFLYLANSPNACSNVDKVKNTVMTINIVYFVSGNTLWRRTIMPANYTTAGCSVPWQQPSCSIGQTAAFCKTQDIKVLENITNFSLTYYNGANSDTILTDATDYTKADSVRKTVLATADTAKVSLTIQATASGKTISKDTSLRISRLPEFKEYTGPPLTWQTPSGQLLDIFTTKFYSTAIYATNAISYILDSGSLPPGMSLNSSTGVISGTFTSSALSDYTTNYVYSFSIKASGEADSKTRSFSINGNSIYTGRTCATAGEGGTASASTPAGYIIKRIDFVSYGTPNGSCGSFTVGGCHAGYSLNSSIGTTSFSLGANNGVFGDPCYGVSKRLYIQVSHGPS